MDLIPIRWNHVTIEVERELTKRATEFTAKLSPVDRINLKEELEVELMERMPINEVSLRRLSIEEVEDLIGDLALWHVLKQ